MPHGTEPEAAPVIDVDLVRGLIDVQFPQWSHLPVTPVVTSGWDNRTFHLGSEMSVRLPSAAHYVAQVEKEHKFLPGLAAHLPLPIPQPLAMGAPGGGYPWPWSVYRWLEGERVSTETIVDMPRFAAELAQFLGALQAVDVRDGPLAGTHNFYRGGDLSVYDQETVEAVALLDAELEADKVLAVWRRALVSNWEKVPVWVHGDVAKGNLLQRGGKLCAVIDFGCSGVGDPACDLVMAWTLFDVESRAAFRAALPLDIQTWERARGWALWKALITVVEHRYENAIEADKARRVIAAVMRDD